MIIGNKVFNENHTYIMGILNVTPDSFSDGGKYNSIDKALKHCEQMLKEGADIIDIGGESTRPNYTKISDEEEISRTVPVIEAIKKNFDVPISIDTYKSKVAEETLKVGADLLNDIWGLKYDIHMADVVKKYDVPCCLMHNRDNTNYSENFIQDVKNDLLESVKIAENHGIAKDKIILDMGVGFAKGLNQNLQIMKHLNEFNELGYPILLGTSRKSMIGLTLNLPSDERVEGTIVTSVMAVQCSCMFVRVHDVLQNKRAIEMAEAILNS
ncbi:MAG: dihydropteroate synthase [Oscillospiraceae bacterium]